MDTALAAYLAKPDQRAYDLTDLALRYLKRELRVDAPTDGQLTLDGLGDEGVAEENVMLRARATLDLADTLIEELSRHAGHADIIREAVDGATMYELIAGLEGWPATPWLTPWQPAETAGV